MEPACFVFWCEALEAPLRGLLVELVPGPLDDEDCAAGTWRAMNLLAQSVVNS